GDRTEVAGHPDAAQRVGHQWKARDRRDRNVLQRDHRRDALPVSTISAATWSASRVCAIRSGHRGPLARAGLGSGQLARARPRSGQRARARLGGGPLRRPRLRSGLVQARLGAPEAGQRRQRRQRELDDLAHDAAELLVQRAGVVWDAVALADLADLLGDLAIAVGGQIREEVVLDLVAEVAREDVEELAAG